MIDPEQSVALMKEFPGRNVTPDVSDPLNSGVSDSKRVGARRILFLRGDIGKFRRASVILPMGLLPIGFSDADAVKVFHFSICHA